MNTNTTLTAPAAKTIFSRPTHDMPGGRLLPEDENYRTIESSDFLGSGGFSITGFISAADADLICRAFNEHEALVAVAEAANYACRMETVNMTVADSRRMAAIREALANLAAIRNQK